MVEYEDEFGRIRTARKSEVPRHLVKRDDDIPTQKDEIEYVPFPIEDLLLLSDLSSSGHRLFLDQPLCYLYVAIIDIISCPFMLTCWF